MNYHIPVITQKPAEDHTFTKNSHMNIKSPNVGIDTLEIITELQQPQHGSQNTPLTITRSSFKPYKTLSSLAHHYQPMRNHQMRLKTSHTFIQTSQNAVEPYTIPFEPRNKVIHHVLMNTEHPFLPAEPTHMFG